MAAVQLGELEFRTVPVISYQDYLDNESSYSKDDALIIAHDPSLHSLTGPQSIVTLLVSSAEGTRSPFFHTGCAYLPSTGEVYTTSSLLTPTSSSRLPAILISRVTLRTADNKAPSPSNPTVTLVEWSKLRPPPGMRMPAGCTAFRDGVLYAEQGSLGATTTTVGKGEAVAGILYMPHRQPPKSITRGYMGRPFNSPRAVATGRDSVVWFTDTQDGEKWGYRGRTKMGCGVYRLDLKTMKVRKVADGFVRPVGVAISGDGGTIYVAEAGGYEEENEREQGVKSQAIYAFDGVERNGGIFLANKRLFANPWSSCLQMIQCDASGRIFAACSDGLEIWDSAGEFLGVIKVPGGVSSFAFGSCNDIILGGSQRLWRVELNAIHKSGDQ